MIFAATNAMITNRTKTGESSKRASGSGQGTTADDGGQSGKDDSSSDDAEGDVVRR